MSSWYCFWHPKEAEKRIDYLTAICERESDSKIRYEKESIERLKALQEIGKLVDDAPYYSWQRVWQNVVKLKYGLPKDASIEDMQVAIMLDGSK